MRYIYDRTTMSAALCSGLDEQLHALLTTRFAALVTAAHDLTDWTEYLVVEPGDTEDDIIRHVGFSPLVEPIDGRRFGTCGFQPFWDWLEDHGGWYELIITFGSTFAYVLFIQNKDGVLPDLIALCARYSGEADR